MKKLIVSFIIFLFWQNVAVAQISMRPEAINVQPEASVRFIQSGVLLNSEKNAYLIGLHIKMTKDWKTYWRVPGDSGIPPHFDWANSKNIKNISVLWPAPEKLKDPYGVSFGYKDEVVFPVRVEVFDKTKPVDVKLKLAFGVCKEICILKDSSVETSIPSNGQSHLKDHVLLTKYLNKVPKKITLNAKPENADLLPYVTKVKADLTNRKKPYLLFHVLFPEGSKKKNLFVEASDGFYLATPTVKKGETSQTDANRVMYHIDLTKGDPVKDLVGKTLNLTLVSSNAQTETSWTIK